MKPEILQDKVNYEVTGANVWKHAPSIAGMSNGKMRFHLTPLEEGGARRLSGRKPNGDEYVEQTVDLADRSDLDKPRPGGGLLGREVDSTNGLVFMSDPFATPVEVSGLYSGFLEFTTNKRDFDFRSTCTG